MEVDVSEIINDADFDDLFYVIRSVETVDAHGRATWAQTTTPAWGSVQPASGRTLEIIPEASRASEAIEIWTQFGLQETTDATAADIVVWNNKHYKITHTDSWGQAGDGFVHVVCTREEVQSQSSAL